MALKQLLEEDETINEINVVPFVDIVLVLLIIFMVTTQFIKDEDPEEERALPEHVTLELPRAKSGESSEKSSLLSVVMSAEGELYLNGEITSLDDIKRQVKALQDGHIPVEAFVAADKRLSHGDVLNVVDQLRLMGVSQVGINTKAMELE